MPTNYSTFQIPSFAQPEAYHFDTTAQSLSIYQELTAIADEIAKCRARNS